MHPIALLPLLQDTLEKLPEEDFVRHREALASRRLERPKKLSHLTANWWAEITTNQYNFDRDALEVDHLRTLNKPDVIEFYKVSVYSDCKWCVTPLSLPPPPPPPP